MFVLLACAVTMQAMSLPFVVNPAFLSCIHRHLLPVAHRVLPFRYWRYNEEMRTMDPGYPKPITVWRGVPDSPQGAFVDKANGTMCPAFYSDLAATARFTCQTALISAAHWYIVCRSEPE